MKICQYFCCLFFCLITTSNCLAENTVFKEGDAFFPSLLRSSRWKQKKVNTNGLHFHYYRNAEESEDCGFDGMNNFKIEKPPKSLIQFIDWVILEKTNKEKPNALVLVYPKRYDQNKYGFFRRYNEKLTDIKGGGMFIQRTKKEFRLSSQVPALKIKKTGTINAKDIDFYFMESGSWLDDFEKYANGEKGLKIYRWRSGEITLLIHNGSLWKEQSFQIPKNKK